jgi:hypothetical protein
VEEAQGSAGGDSVTPVDPAASAAAKALRALRKTHEGRPAVWHQCPHCGDLFRASVVRNHKARCEKNPRRIARILDELVVRK